MEMKEENKLTLKQFVLRVIFWVSFFKQKLKLLVIIGLIGALLGLLYSLFTPSKYKAITTFALDEDKNSGSIAGYLGVASQLGVDLGGSGGSVFAGDNIMELLKSRRVIERTLYQRATINGQNKSFADQYIDLFEMREELDEKGCKGLNFNKVETGRLGFLQDSIGGVIYEQITKHVIKVLKLDKKLSIYNIEIITTNEGFSKEFSTQLVDQLMDYYIQTKIQKSMVMVNVLQHKADSLKLAYEAALYNVAQFNDVNRNISRQILSVNSLKKQTEVQILGNYYSEVIKNLEMSKISLLKQTPLIQKIDTPKYPLEIVRIRKIVAMLIGSLLFVTVTSLVLMSRKVYEELMLES